MMTGAEERAFAAEVHRVGTAIMALVEKERPEVVAAAVVTIAGEIAGINAARGGLDVERELRDTAATLVAIGRQRYLHERMARAPVAGSA